MGGGPWFTPDTHVYQYLPAYNQWRTFPALPRATRNSATAQLGAALYLIGGYDLSTGLADTSASVERYLSDSLPSPSATR